VWSLDSGNEELGPAGPHRMGMRKVPPVGEGWHGWDEYARFYDWENARTLGRRDVAFWQRLAHETGGPALELGCGTGRIAGPVASTLVRVVGVDRSERMLAVARRRFSRRGARRRPLLVRGDIRALPFDDAAFPLVMAPYGILQSLLTDADLDAALGAAARVLAPGGTFALDLVPDLPQWDEYERRVRLRGRTGARGHVTLVESVRQDRRRRLTIFDQEFVERRHGRAARRRFTLTFRTLGVRQMTGRLVRAGLTVRAVLGDYQGGRWDPRADVWVVVAGKPGRS
jgi:SAM-dependent methyltransferase